MAFENPATKQEYICEQYSTRSNLKIRIDTHERYTVPKADFHAAILGQRNWDQSETVLDVGCGTGSYADPVQDRCRRYIAGDLSIGMLQTLPTSVTEKVNLNAALIPFKDDSMDVVLANHMLYHVIELDQALEEIYRVLKPKGSLIAATNSESYMPEVVELQRYLMKRFGIPADTQVETGSPLLLRFTLENGAQILSRVFPVVERHDLSSALVFSESEPLITYLGSMRRRYERFVPAGTGWDEIAAALREEIDRQIEISGEFRVSKLAGVFVCKKQIG